MKKLLRTYIIDDEPVICKTLSKLLQLESYAVRAFPSAEEFLAQEIDPGSYVLIVDKNLPGMSGVELLEKYQLSGHAYESILITGYAEMESAIQAVRLGCYSYVKKPFDFDLLLKDVAGAAKRLAQKSRAAHPSNAEVINKILRPLSASSAHFTTIRRELELHSLPPETSSNLDFACTYLQRLVRWLEMSSLEDQLGKQVQDTPLEAAHLVGSFRAVVEELNNLPYSERRAVLWMNATDVQVLAEPSLLPPLLRFLAELAFDEASSTEPVMVDLDIDGAHATLHLVIQNCQNRHHLEENQKRLALCIRLAAAQQGKVRVAAYHGDLGIDFSLSLLLAPDVESE